MKIKYAITVYNQRVLVGNFQPIARMSDGGDRYVVGDIFSDDGLDLPKICKRLGATCTQLLFTIHWESDLSFDSLDNMIVGYELAATELIEIDTQNIFSCELPAPCIGIVDPSTSLFVSERPHTKLLVSAGLETIFNIDCLQRIFAANTLKTDIRLDGEVLVGWHRIRPDTVDCIPQTHFFHTQCRLCGEPYLSDFGLRFGRPFDSDSLVRNSIGEGHFGFESIYLASCKLLPQLYILDETEICINPILNIDSIAFTRVREIIDSFGR